MVDYTVRIARHLRLRGLVNVQYVVHRGKVHVLEVNPRASRTVPFISKVTGVPMVDMATKVMLGQKLSDMGWTDGSRAAARPRRGQGAGVFDEQAARPSIPTSGRR